MAEYVIDPSLLGGKEGKPQAPQQEADGGGEFVIDPSLLQPAQEPAASEPSGGGILDYLTGAATKVKEAFSGPEGLKYADAPSLMEYLEQVTRPSIFGRKYTSTSSKKKAANAMMHLTMGEFAAKSDDELLGIATQALGDMVSRVETDKGYPVIFIKEGDREVPVYLNKPGLDSQDIERFVAYTLPYFPAAGLAGKVVPYASGALALGTRATAQGAAAAATNLAQSGAASEMGADVPKPLHDALLAAAGGAGGEVAGAALGRLINMFKINRLVGKDGKLTEKGVQLARQLGIDAPEDLTPEAARTFAEAYVKVAPEYRAIGEGGKSAIARKVEATDLGIQGTTAQYTKNPADIEFVHDVLRGDFGTKAQEVMRRTIPAQTEAKPAIDKAVSKQVLEPGQQATAERIGAQIPETIDEADASAIASLKGDYEKARSEASKLMPGEGEAVLIEKKALKPLADEIKLASMPAQGRSDGLIGRLHDVATKAANGGSGPDVAAFKLIQEWTSGKLLLPPPAGVSKTVFERMNALRTKAANIRGAIQEIDNKIRLSPPRERIILNRERAKLNNELSNVGAEYNALRQKVNATPASDALSIRSFLQEYSDNAAKAARDAGKPATTSGAYKSIAFMRDMVDRHLARLAEKGALSEGQARQWIDEVSLDNLMKWRRGMDAYRRINAKFFERWKGDKVGAEIRKLIKEDNFNAGRITGYILGSKSNIDRRKFAARIKELLGENSPEWQLLKGRVLDAIVRTDDGKLRSIDNVVNAFNTFKRKGPWKEMFAADERKRIERFIKAAENLKLEPSQGRALQEGLLAYLVKKFLHGRAQGAATFQGNPVKGTFYRFLARLVSKGIVGRMTGGGLSMPGMKRTAEKFAKGWLPERKAAPAALPAIGGALPGALSGPPNENGGW